MLVNHFLFIEFRGPDVIGVGKGGDDFARDKAILAKAIDSLEMSALEKQVSVRNKLTVDFGGGKRVETLQDRFWSASVTR